jgi:hypothetical protein
MADPVEFFARVISRAIASLPYGASGASGQRQLLTLLHGNQSVAITKELGASDTYLGRIRLQLI